MRTIEYIEERDRWWDDLQKRIHKLNSDLEDALYEHFEELKFDNPPRPEDPDFSIVNNIWNMVMAIEEVIKMRRQVLDIALRKYYAFCSYWEFDEARGGYPNGRKPFENYDGFTRKVVG